MIRTTDLEGRVRSIVSEDAIEDFKQRTEDKLRDVRCPRHHQAPRVKFLGSSLQEMTIQMSGCCKQLIELANRAIAEKP